MGFSSGSNGSKGPVVRGIVVGVGCQWSGGRIDVETDIIPDVSYVTFTDQDLVPSVLAEARETFKVPHSHFVLEKISQQPTVQVRSSLRF